MTTVFFLESLSCLQFLRYENQNRKSGNTSVKNLVINNQIFKKERQYIYNKHL